MEVWRPCWLGMLLFCLVTNMWVGRLQGKTREANLSLGFVPLGHVCNLAQLSRLNLPLEKVQPLHGTLSGICAGQNENVPIANMTPIWLGRIQQR